MGLLDKAKKWFKRDGDEGPLTLRRWAAAGTDRLNKGHWSRVTNRSINVDLASHLETLRARCEHEATMNSDVEGVINTHVTDVIGPNGPTLQVKSSDEEYNAKLEELWHDWWAHPEVTGQLSGVEVLDQNLRLLWTAGEHLNQIVNGAQINGPIKMRLKTIHPRRLAMSPELAGDPDVVLGVRRNKLGEPVEYIINTAPDSLLSGMGLGQTTPIPAQDIIHVFRVLEPDQVRGVPWLATSLQAIADLHDYETHVLRAAKMAALYGILLSTKNPEAPFQVVNETMEIEGGEILTMPPLYEASQMVPQQPTTRYVDYHNEMSRKLGRGVGMPLMTIKADSSKHNYSSARFDGQNYQRAVEKVRGSIERTMLNRLVELLAREAALGKVLGPAPDDVRYRWNWPRAPHVDPWKEAKAVTERLEVNRTSTLRDEYGGDWEELLEQQRRERERRESFGLPVPGGGAQGKRKMMEDLARAVRAGVPVTVAEARTLGLGLPSEPEEGADQLRFNDQDVLEYHVGHGVLTINEIRERLDLPAVSWGDQPVRRTGIETVDTATPKGSTEGDTEDDEDEEEEGEEL